MMFTLIQITLILSTVSLIGLWRTITCRFQSHALIYCMNSLRNFLLQGYYIFGIDFILHGETSIGHWKYAMNSDLMIKICKSSRIVISIEVHLINLYLAVLRKNYLWHMLAFSWFMKRNIQDICVAICGFTSAFLLEITSGLKMKSMIGSIKVQKL
jgi:hypothetical protein